MINRRDGLKLFSSMTAIAPFGGSASGFDWLQSAESSKDASDAEIERLAGEIMDTSPERVARLGVDKIKSGWSLKDLHAACFNAGARFHGHHSGFVAHPVSVVSNSIDPKYRALPFFYYLSVLRFRAGRSRVRKIDGASLPKPDKALPFFHEAMKEGDTATADRCIASIGRAIGPKKAFQNLWVYGAQRNGRSGGHTGVSVANTFRIMESTDWKCGETGLRFSCADSVHPPIGLDKNGTNIAFSNREDELPRDWLKGDSDPGVTREIVSLLRKGNPHSACTTVFRLLNSGKAKAGAVWDAVFLTTAELIVRYQWVGQKRLAGHSVTCVNALHYMYRTVSLPATRLYSLIEAVEWTTSFLARERARPALRDFDLLALKETEKSRESENLKEEEALDQIFELLPPRRFASMSRIGFKDVDKAMGLVFAWAKSKTNYEPFLQRAMFLMCIKATPEVHDFKFPMALFENLAYASPRWRPHLLAASVHVLHGTDMEESPIVAEARSMMDI